MTGGGSKTSDFNGDGNVDFGDFLAFAAVFGADSADDRFDDRFDLNGDSDIGFPDFLEFAQAFGGAN